MEPTQQTPLAIWNTARDAWEEPHTEGLFCEHLDVFSETWPTSGSMRSGAVYALPTWEPHTDASASSCLLPTVTTQDGANNGGPSQFDRNTPPLNTRVLMLPTPSANIGDNGGTQHPDKRRAGGHQPSIADVAEHKLLPTPVTQPDTGNGHARNLGKEARMLPTPRATRGGSGTETMYRFGAERSDSGRTQGEVLLRTPCAAEAEGGPRNPDRPGATMRLSDQVREEAQRGKLLPSPRASEGEKGGPNMRGSKGDLMLSSAVTSLGASTSRRSDAGKQLWEDVPLPLPNPRDATEATD